MDHLSVNPARRVETYSTLTMPPGTRAHYWRGLVAQAFPGMVADVHDEIRADLARFSLGRIGIARARSEQARVRRSGDGNRESMIVLHAQRRGRMTFEQDCGLACGAVGDIIVVDDSQPYSLDISDHNDCLILEIPKSLIEIDAKPADWHGLLLSRRDPNVGFLSQMVESLWMQRERITELGEGIDALVVTAAEIACRAAMQGAGPESTSESPVQFARRHLDDPELSTAMISEATGLSPRAVQKSFARYTRQTPTAYITEQRLARAADRLSADLHQSITAIAFDVGFSDSAFFSRCFRRCYGLTPSEWRAKSTAS